MKPGHHETFTTLYFERDNIFSGFNIGDTISYFGLFLTEGASWTDYFIFNHSKNTFTKLFFAKAINNYIFYNSLDITSLTSELENKMKTVEIP